MLLGNRNPQGGVIGVELSDRYAQISYWLSGSDKPETPAQGAPGAGGEENMIPVLLCRRMDRDVWTYGKEAARSAATGEGILVDRLLSRALSEERVEVGGEIYDGATLLALFLKRCMSLLSGIMNTDRADMLMLTLEHADGRARQMVLKLAAFLSMPPDRVACQSRAESFFYYNINQPEELWRHPCMICDFSGEQMKILLFEANHHTRPVSVTVLEEDFPEMSRELSAGAVHREAEKARLDARFCAVLGKACAGRIIDTIYLIGDGFEGEWYDTSLGILCRGRRVFQGNNLYSKGACYGGRVKSPGEKKSLQDRSYVYLGADMLHANVGLLASRGGGNLYYPLLEAGTNWFEASGECDFLLDADMAFSLQITPLSGREAKEVVVTLDGLPERPPKTTRIHLEVSCPDAENVLLKMEDRGFGELYPSSHRIWEESFTLA